MRIFLAIAIFCGIFCSAASGQHQADAKFDPADKFVAAGIALKVELLVDEINTDSNGFDLSQPESIKRCFETIGNDVESFSATESGEKMQTSAREMIDLLSMIYTEKVPSKDGKLTEYLAKNGIDNGAPDVTKLVALINGEIKSFAQECKVPAGIFRTTQMKQLLNPPTEDPAAEDEAGK